MANIFSGTSDGRTMKGRKKDLVRKRYFRDNSRQAELLNVYTKKRRSSDGEQGFES